MALEVLREVLGTFFELLPLLQLADLDVSFEVMAIGSSTVLFEEGFDVLAGAPVVPGYRGLFLELVGTACRWIVVFDCTGVFFFDSSDSVKDEEVV